MTDSSFNKLMKQYLDYMAGVCDLQFKEGRSQL